MRTAYADLSPEQREIRQEQDREQHRTAYAAHSPVERHKRQEQNSERRRITRLSQESDNI